MLATLYWSRMYGPINAATTGPIELLIDMNPVVCDLLSDPNHRALTSTPAVRV